MINQTIGYLSEHIPSNNRLERIWKLGIIDFKKRYYNSYLGLFWAFLNPVLNILVYFIVFTYIFKNNIENFAFYIFVGYLFWLAFTEGTMKCFGLLKSKSYLIENIQFNKLDLYLSALLSVLMGFVFNLSAYILISLIAGVELSWHIIFLPITIINLSLIILGSTLVLSSLNIFMKDLHMLWSIILLTGFWATPIFHDHVRLFEVAPWMKWLNPLSGIIVNARNVLLYELNPIFTLLGYNFGFGVMLTFIGIRCYNKLGIYASEMK